MPYFVDSRETELQRLGPPYHDEQTRANQTQAGRQQLKRRGQREKENRKLKQRQRKGTERLKEGEGEKGNKGEDVCPSQRRARSGTPPHKPVPPRPPKGDGANIQEEKGNKEPAG